LLNATDLYTALLEEASRPDQRTGPPFVIARRTFGTTGSPRQPILASLSAKTPQFAASTGAVKRSEENIQRHDILDSFSIRPVRREDSRVAFGVWMVPAKC
jgi:hypothetical protein